MIRQKCGILIILISLFYAGPVVAENAEMARYFQQQGLVMGQNGDLSSALLNLRTALRFDPGNSEIEGQLSIAYNNYALALAPEEIDHAIIILNQAYQLVPENLNVTRNLAGYYNQRGVKLAETGAVEGALPYFEKAAQLQPDNHLYRRNAAEVLSKLGYEAYENRRFVKSKEYLSRALTLSAENVTALITLGSICYDEQNMEQAIQYWRQALEVQPGLSNLHTLIAQAERENKVESTFSDMTSFHFEIRFEGTQRRYEVYDVLRELEAAYDMVGHELHRYPDHKIVALIYSRENYQALTGSPTWTGAIYDGKIRVPMENITGDRDRLRGILRHEYTHALVHELTRNNCPVWLNEGLAQYMELRNRHQPSLENLRQALQDNKIYPLTAMENSFMHLEADAAKMAYEQSFAMTEYIIQRYGFWSVNRVLDKLRERTAWSQVLWDEFQLTPERFAQQWQRYFYSRHGN